MATRSFIAKKVKGGYKAIYCHWDGYPEKPGAGWMLKTYYNTPTKVNKLMALGDVSSLNPEIGKKHRFDDREHPMRDIWTLAYGRDRGESWSRVKPKFYSNLKELMFAAYHGGAEYVYIFTNGKWSHRTVKTPASEYGRLGLL